MIGFPSSLLTSKYAHSLKVAPRPNLASFSSTLSFLCGAEPSCF
jgi:hypothetical protein